MILKEDKFQIKAIAKDALSNKKINISFTPPTDDDALTIATSFSSTLSIVIIIVLIIMIEIMIIHVLLLIAELFPYILSLKRCWIILN